MKFPELFIMIKVLKAFKFIKITLECDTYSWYIRLTMLVLVTMTAPNEAERLLRRCSELGCSEEVFH